MRHPPGVRLTTGNVPEPLTRYVAGIWHFEADTFSHARERLVPNGCLQLLVNLDEDELRWDSGPELTSPNRVSGAAVGGALDTAIAIDTGQQRRITGVSFHPGGAAACLPLPPSELAGTHVDFRDLYKRSAYRERLLEAGTASAVLDVWAHILLEMLRLHHERADAQMLEAARSLGVGRAVGRVATDLGLSARRFRTRFTETVGLPPKRFGKVQRLQRLLVEAAARPSSSWAELAAGHGYHDQAHMIHDFRELSGITPSEYRARSAEDWNHVLP